MRDQKDVVDIIRSKYAALKDRFDERSRRIWSATEANALGHGGVELVATATGIARSTIRIGRRELEADDSRLETSDPNRVSAWEKTTYFGIRISQINSFTRTSLWSSEPS